jgi:hypothetical protein
MLIHLALIQFLSVFPISKTFGTMHVNEFDSLIQIPDNESQ